MIDLQKLSKADLIFIVERLAFYADPFNVSHYIKRAVSDLKLEKDLKRLAEADEYAAMAHEKRREFCDLMAPYDGMSLQSVPAEVIHKANAALAEADRADDKYEKLMSQK